MKIRKHHMKCPCNFLKPLNDDLEQILSTFTEIREQCPAIKKILVPDDIWTDFKTVALSEDLEASHRSILLLALERGYLNRITNPIHSFLIENNEPKIINENYIKDLKETWLEGTAEKRHSVSRGYMGKLSELLLAQWLIERGWSIKDLAALNGKADIEAISPEGLRCWIEVKYVGVSDDYFKTTIKNAEERVFTISLSSSSSSSDFLLYRVYEAAKQFKDFQTYRIAVLLISENNWDLIRRPIEENWMNWEAPNFYCSKEVLSMIYKNKVFSCIKREINETPKILNELWVIKAKSNFEYLKEKELFFKKSSN